MTERDMDLMRQAREYERRIGIDPHRRHPAHGNEMRDKRKRARRRWGRAGLREYARAWNGG